MTKTLGKNKRNFTLKVINKGKVIDRVQTHSLRAFLPRLHSIKWKNVDFKVYLRVSYGKYKNHLGKNETFYNDGWYSNKKDLLFAFEAFRQES